MAKKQEGAAPRAKRARLARSVYGERMNTKLMCSVPDWVGQALEGLAEPHESANMVMRRIVIDYLTRKGLRPSGAPSKPQRVEWKRNSDRPAEES